LHAALWIYFRKVQKSKKIMVKALATKNVVTVLAALALTLGFTVALTSTAKAATMSAGCYTFTMNSKMGSTGGEVMWVQPVTKRVTSVLQLRPLSSSSRMHTHLTS
jgi:hypothetical protein